MHRERNVILALLLVLAAASWAILVWQSTLMDNVAMGLTMGLGAALFLAIWAVMMVAMMLPTAAPMILMLTRVPCRQEAERKGFRAYLGVRELVSRNLDAIRKC